MQSAALVACVDLPEVLPSGLRRDAVLLGARLTDMAVEFYRQEIREAEAELINAQFGLFT